MLSIYQVSHVAMNVLSDKVWVMDKLSDYSAEVEKQIATLRDSPAHMYQWMAETRDKQAEVNPALLPFTSPLPLLPAYCMQTQQRISKASMLLKMHR
jgi:hypothetical protein